MYATIPEDAEAMQPKNQAPARRGSRPLRRGRERLDDRRRPRRGPPLGGEDVVGVAELLHALPQERV